MQFTQTAVSSSEGNDDSISESSANFGAEIYFPYDISFVDCDTSEAVRYQIEEHLTRLSHFYDRIVDCRVAVRVLHKHRVNRFYHINVQLDVPGKRFAVTRETELRIEHTDIRLAVRDAFQKLLRQLEDFVKIRKNKKSHPKLIESLQPL